MSDKGKDIEGIRPLTPENPDLFLPRDQQAFRETRQRLYAQLTDELSQTGGHEVCVAYETPRELTLNGVPCRLMSITLSPYEWGADRFTRGGEEIYMSRLDAVHMEMSIHVPPYAPFEPNMKYLDPPGILHVDIDSAMGVPVASLEDSPWPNRVDTAAKLEAVRASAAARPHDARELVDRQAYVFTPGPHRNEYGMNSWAIKVTDTLGSEKMVMQFMTSASNMLSEINRPKLPATVTVPGA